MAQFGWRVDGELIVLTDSETEGEEADYLDVGEAFAEPRQTFPVIVPDQVDLATIPDVDVPPSDPIESGDSRLQHGGQAPSSSAQARVITESECLQMVLSVLPDISAAYARGFIQQRTANHSRPITIDRCEQLISQLLEGEPYPKEAIERKRKREDDVGDDFSDYEKGERDPEIDGYEHDATELLKDEFLIVPEQHIISVIRQQKTLYKAYGVLEKQVRDYGLIIRSSRKTAKSRNKRGVEFELVEKGSQLPKELHAAKKKLVMEAAKRRKVKEAQEAEEANLHYARMNDQMGECACCFDEVPLNRMITCNGSTVHLYCKDCVRQQIETQMGQSRCRPKCFGVDDCDGTFSRGQLQEVLDKTTFERLEHMQQMEDLQEAGLDFLSECPFCDFKMECPPIEVDKEFRCQNAKCGKTSCRICNKESHIPLSCDEAKKEGHITLRHVVEEAMSAALIRHCNRCKHPFIKEAGCNKMTCTHCRNLQCYVCSKNVTDYSHFGEAQAGKCPLHEDIEERHEQEVKRAADEAMAKVRTDNPDISDADLMVKVSDQVKQLQEARRVRMQAEEQEFPYHMVDGHVRRVPRVAPVAVQPLFPFYNGAPLGAVPLHLHPQHVNPAVIQNVGPYVAPQPAVGGPEALRDVQQAHQAPGFGEAGLHPRHRYFDGLARRHQAIIDREFRMGQLRQQQAARNGEIQMQQQQQQQQARPTVGGGFHGAAGPNPPHAHHLNDLGLQPQGFEHGENQMAQMRQQQAVIAERMLVAEMTRRGQQDARARVAERQRRAAE